MRTILVLLAWSVCLWVPGAAAAATHYVDEVAPPGGDGSSWNTAFAYLQDALAVAQPGDFVLVAGGTYRPDRSTGSPGGNGNRTATFSLESGVTLRGGYAGSGGADPDARDLALYETILSGDLLGDDQPGFVNVADNALHVVTGSGVDASAVLDGFTIVGGNADFTATPFNAGGGLYCSAGSPTVRDCVFRGNSARYGGAARHDNGSPAYENCTFEGNRAVLGGGAVYNYAASPTLSQCVFRGNTADDGGAMYNRSAAAPVLTGCAFEQNAAVRFSGGAVFSSENSTPSYIGCTFSGNTAETTGGALYNNYSHGTLLACSFSGCSADNGGAVYNYNSSPQMHHVRFEGNSAIGSNVWGGAVHNRRNSDPLLNNCVFVGNSAVYGGAIGAYDDCAPVIRRCTFAGNTAGFGAALAASSFQSEPNAVTLRSSVLWNGGGELWKGDASVLDVAYCNVQGGWAGAGNVDVDPQFVDSPGGDVHLASDSPCIQAGDPADVPASSETDCDGEPRLGGARVDMGYDEYHDCNGNGVADRLDLAAATSADCDANAVPDECDLAAGTARDCNANGVFDACEPGDFNGDGRVDLVDHAAFSTCFGADVAAQPECACADFDLDGDVDLGDFSTLSVNFTE